MVPQTENEKSLTCPTYEENDQDEQSQEKQLGWKWLILSQRTDNFNTLE